MKDLQKLYDRTVGKCKKCTNGIILKNGEFTDCTCMKRFKKLSKLLLANIPKKYHTFSLRNLTSNFREDNQIPLKIISKYVENIGRNIEHGNGLYFQASAGLGKTALACWILMQAINQNHTVGFIKYSDLISLQFNVLKNDEEAQDFLSYLNKCDIVCIDRIDKGYAGSEEKYATKQLDKFFSNLYDNSTALLVTSGTARNDTDFPFASLLDELVDIIFVGTPFRNSERTLKDIMR